MLLAPLLASAQTQYYFPSISAAVGLGTNLDDTFREANTYPVSDMRAYVQSSTNPDFTGLRIISQKARADGACPEVGASILSLEPKKQDGSHDGARSSVYHVLSDQSYVGASDGKCYEYFLVKGDRWADLDFGLYHINVNHPGYYSHNQVEMLFAKLDYVEVEKGDEIVSIAIFGPSMSVGRMTSGPHCLARVKDGNDFSRVIAEDPSVPYSSNSGLRCNGFFRFFDLVFPEGNMVSATLDFKMDILTSSAPVSSQYVHRTHLAWRF